MCNNPILIKRYYFKTLMIVEEHITQYLHSLERDNDPFLEELRAYAEKHEVPIIRREMESFLRVLLDLHHPERILEIGTGIAYSAVFMAGCAKSVKEIDTIENYPPRIEKAKEVIAAYEKGDDSFADMKGSGEKAKIRLIEGDAAEEIRKLEGPYDMIFLDGPKAQYLSMLPELLRLLRSGGVLLADNVLQEGELVKSRYVTQRRDRTIHERMRDFVWEVKHHPELVTSVITIGDGVTLSVKRSD